MKYGTAEQAQEAQQYLVSNFSSSALAIEEEEMEEAFEGNDAHRLERLQAFITAVVTSATQEWTWIPVLLGQYGKNDPGMSLKNLLDVGGVYESFLSELEEKPDLLANAELIGSAKHPANVF
ncbi:hypothetical protein B0H14DRAFT_3446621 [Mycena olivaceomarginata]|nr:hypothetical protein B0H14DRAFT_3446621 [Mycena olivaceomarginata]